MDAVAAGDGALRMDVTGPSLADAEVIDERPVRVDGLRAHPGGRGHRRRRARARAGRCGPRRGRRAATANRASRGPPPASAGGPAARTPRTGPAGTARQRHVPPAVPLPGQREHGVRAEVDLAVDARGQVHAEERVRGVGHRVDELPHPAARVRPQPQVLAAERDDLRRGLVAGRRASRSACRPAQITSRDSCVRPARGRHQDAPVISVTAHRGDRGAVSTARRPP